MVQRWTLHDPLLNEDYVFAVNPNRMTSPLGPRSIDIVATPPRPGSATVQGRVLEHNPDPYQWSFSGYIRTQEHHDALLHWSRKVNRLVLTDHLGHTYSIRFIAFVPDEKKPTATRPWRFDYEMKAYNYGLVS